MGVVTTIEQENVIGKLGALLFGRMEQLVEETLVEPNTPSFVLLDGKQDDVSHPQ
ncbi:uncharacterized protein PHALS_04534 [Plasmopara halstedii]|uniref:Uncharacterized protein n=1 Tax=Plasmopara halstedii TaxID=4781 RepID=A0A0P1A8Q9_PLAHL|nr:uncharacterized protein PHALS_04534 [Plasmopara halstedii]CEG37073.1 hypothetical protein PHALS_04534 [Plasmopara halstedii]|eukprot:XP_024573442.1 hypothetical protein PHALS_04534 [Plasmopara halstedii]